MASVVFWKRDINKLALRGNIQMKACLRQVWLEKWRSTRHILLSRNVELGNVNFKLNKDDDVAHLSHEKRVIVCVHPLFPKVLKLVKSFILGEVFTQHRLLHCCYKFYQENIIIEVVNRDATCVSLLLPVVWTIFWINEWKTTCWHLSRHLVFLEEASGASHYISTTAVVMLT